ncbi:MAG: hypothetical protein M3O25_11785 [Actinomycetota bacterium]|nr:hypothetical protein [Actinomycetota bacterium]
METGGDRSSEERRAAAEARARAREGRPDPGDEELVAASGEPAHAPEDISRYGVADPYARRRLLAILAVAVIVIVLFVLLVGC